MNWLILGQYLPGEYDAPTAVILNGDLTEYGQGDQWDKYEAIYLGPKGSCSGDIPWVWCPGIKAPVYEGLGNHDYENNVGDCGWPDTNSCAKSSVKYMHDWLKDHREQLEDFDADSLAYSWEMGNVHFIQLHNYPTYKEPDIDIKASIDWLKEDLARAYTRRKWIVINMHDFGGNANGKEADFIDAIRGFEYNVVGIFAGHIHEDAGKQGKIRVNDTQIPWFRSGSMEHSMFNLVRFFSDDEGSHMEVTVIDSASGTPVAMAEAGTTQNCGDASAPYTSTFPVNECEDPGYQPESGVCAFETKRVVSVGLLGTEAEKDDHVGWAVATGDFNGDGLDDLAVGAPQEDVDGKNDAGLVHVVYGSPVLGLTAKKEQWSQDSPGIKGAVEDNDQFGYALAIGDFDCDGYDDLAVGVPKEDLEGNSKDNAGLVNVIYGSAGGLTASGDQEWTQDNDGAPGAVESDDHYGWALAAGDFDGDGCDDLAIGSPKEDLNSGGNDNDGMVVVLYGSSSSGLSSDDSENWIQNYDAGASQKDDHYGQTLAAGDFNGDGYDDLAIGAPTEDVNDHDDAGKIVVIYGRSSGLSRSSSESWHQDKDGFSGHAEEGDQFGYALAAGDFDGDGYEDLAIGVPKEDLDSGDGDDDGLVLVMYGTSSGLSDHGSDGWSQGNDGAPGESQAHDQYGQALAAGDFDGDGYDDLAIGTPLEDVGGGGEDNDGKVVVIYGTSSGLHSNGGPGGQSWTQDKPGVPGSAEKNDQFGFALAAGDFNGDGREDLAIGAPEEDLAVGDNNNEGMVIVLHGSDEGLSTDELPAQALRQRD
jgi:cytolysin (calcineurin-like family phosphatase)